MHLSLKRLKSTMANLIILHHGEHDTWMTMELPPFQRQDSEPRRVERASTPLRSMSSVTQPATRRPRVRKHGVVDAAARGKTENSVVRSNVTRIKCVKKWSNASKYDT
ncbi:hypothetical protein TNCV_1910941 [Trichonephila clavipes]|nr:hypothetical protein TNCV_1910941 [Trichonephila clavipes]